MMNSKKNRRRLYGRRQRHRMHEHVSHHPKRYLPLPVTLNIILIRAEGHTTGKVGGVGPSRILAWALFSVKIGTYRIGNF